VENSTITPLSDFNSFYLKSNDKTEIRFTWFLLLLLFFAIFFVLILVIFVFILIVLET